MTSPLITVEDLKREGVFPNPAESKESPRLKENYRELSLDLMVQELQDST